MNIKQLSIVLSLAFVCMSGFASSIPHTWHTVSTTNGTWNAKLQMINQNGSFVNRDGASISEFTIHPAQSYDYGFVLDPHNDFDVAYTLTLVQQSRPNSPNFSSKACVYVITAASPANPDVRPSSYHGADCKWNVVHGVGENFQVS